MKKLLALLVFAVVFSIASCADDQLTEISTEVTVSDQPSTNGNNEGDPDVPLPGGGR